ncbi:hypothetical protein Tgr7_2394 [Thioalkalivibrio sulfidiphilus HL-EbGr7]|uniref:Methanolan biosynthesis EpsI domain-containing protein n=1 Tax=Thioalkalivibrio sulfidiphilus (strain HL-EbGR7) TaxID=396588 RepID=B8GVC6_THISH|nr:EpsI domain-containing exosortase [Thioalkalivibrio sulfidiphilus]ACL73472.1 hypothetical protein Tgr7_2394 [Thioalkalivibrio sulfidiphilus HL-EbGr7]
MNTAALGGRISSMVLPSFLLMLLLGLVLLVYRDVFAGLWSLWLSPDDFTYSHGTMLLALSVGIAAHTLWRDPAALRWAPSYSGGLVLIAAVSLWMLSTLMVVKVGAMLSAWMIVVGTVWAAFGMQGLRRLALPLGLVVFAIPMWFFINEPLRLLTAHAVSLLLAATGVPNILEGAIIGVVPGSFYVDDNCTGLRQLVVAMPLALLYAAWVSLRPIYGVVVFVSAIVLSFAMNTLRIYIVVMAGVMTDMQHYLVREDHVTLGWVLFGIGMAGFFFLAGRLMPERWYRADSTTPPARPESPATTRPAASLLVILTIAIALAVPLGVNRSVSEVDGLAGHGLSLPEAFGPWRMETGAWKPILAGRFRDPDLQGQVVYRREDGARVQVHVAWFQTQREERKLVSWDNRAFDPALWHQQDWNRHSVSTDTQPAVVREDLLSSAQHGQRLVWSWYQLAGRTSASDRSALMTGMLGALCGRPDGAMWVITPLGSAGAERDRVLLAEFLYAGGMPLTDAVQTLSQRIHASSWC